MISVTLKFVPGSTYTVNAEGATTISDLCSYADNLSQEGLDNFTPSVNGVDKELSSSISESCTIIFAKKRVKGNI